MATLGRTLRSLRILAGLSPDEVAQRTALSVAAIRDAERGREVSAIILGALSELYGVDPAQLSESKVAGLDASASLFLFSGDVADLSFADLPQAAWALDRARAHAQTAEGRAGIKLRLERTPSAPTGPKPRDAAIQGHRLARDLRAAIPLGADPVDDFGDVLRRLGIVATSAPLTNGLLRAIAVLDVDRAAAAMVVNTARETSPWGARVAIAHEICHLVYDPVGPDTCLLALDGPTDATCQDLRECRARGFAAEFLLPEQGLRNAFGVASRLSSREDARALVERARTMFSTPWEITVNHLHNLGFIDRAPWSELRFGKGGPSAIDHGLDATLEPSGTLRADVDVAAIGRAAAARMNARATRDAIEVDWNAQAALLVATTREASKVAPLRAAVDLATALDEAFATGRSGLVRAVLEALPPDEVDGEAMVGVLSNVRRSCEVFGSELVDAYRVLAGRTLDALARTWLWSPDDVEGARKVLG
jgi:transcriptional regulator with XRE-family HTH domain